MCKSSIPFLSGRPQSLRWILIPPREILFHNVTHTIELIDVPFIPQVQLGVEQYITWTFCWYISVMYWSRLAGVLNYIIWALITFQPDTWPKIIPYMNTVSEISMKYFNFLLLLCIRNLYNHYQECSKNHIFCAEIDLSL